MKDKRFQYPNVLFICIAFGCFFSLGCRSGSTPPVPTVSAGESKDFEAAFFEVLSDYYCATKSWPAAWLQVEDFERSRGRDVAWLQAVQDPQLSAPRAIFMTLSYKSAEGEKRRATYIAPPRCNNDYDDGIVTIAGEGVVFRLPEGFELMPVKAVQSRWKSPPYPDAAWSAPDDRILAIRFGDVEMRPEELPQFAEDVAEAYEASVASLVWTFKDVKSIRGQPVLYHEFQSTTSSGRILNVVYSGVFDNRLFAITMTGPVERSDAVVQAARQIEQSLQIR